VDNRWRGTVRQATGAKRPEATTEHIGASESSVETSLEGKHAVSKRRPANSAAASALDSTLKATGDAAPLSWPRRLLTSMHHRRPQRPPTIKLSVPVVVRTCTCEGHCNTAPTRNVGDAALLLLPSDRAVECLRRVSTCTVRGALLTATHELAPHKHGGLGPRKRDNIQTKEWSIIEARTA